MKSWNVSILIFNHYDGNTELLAQQDTLIMISGEILIGEIKLFDNGVVTIETSYSDSNFKVEGDKVAQISTVQQFVIINCSWRSLFWHHRHFKERSLHCSD